MTKFVITAAAVFAASIFSGSASAQEAAGEDVFSGRCSGCHSAGSGEANKSGPNLFGVMGSQIGGRDIGFRFSASR